jgi:hypothetical protein
MVIFVEGQTEAIFVRRFLSEIAGDGKIQFAVQGRSGRLNRPRRSVVLWADTDWGQPYYVLIVDSGSDESSVSDAIHYDQSGFSVVAAIRDAYPRLTREQIPSTIDLLRHLAAKSDPLMRKPIPDFVVATMETEAWFIAEHTHFQKIDSNLTLDYIRESVGFDPSTDDVEGRSHPSEDLERIYGLVGVDYDKSDSCVKSTVNKLDCDAMYLELPERMPSLKALVAVIDRFLAVPTTSNAESTARDE